MLLILAIFKCISTINTIINLLPKTKHNREDLQTVIPFLNLTTHI